MDLNRQFQIESSSRPVIGHKPSFFEAYSLIGIKSRIHTPISWELDLQALYHGWRRG
jgi:hypothetical protein